eukprot:Partr_v1_DN25870_c0_g1_i3_m2895 putative TKL LISK LISK-DD1 protein kinase
MDKNEAETIQFQDLSNFQRLGEGNFGRVSRADYIGTDVAVKECLQEVNDDLPPGWDFAKYIRREVETLRDARHPNIVQFMGVCSYDSKFYIVTEYVPGGNLKEWMLREEDDQRLNEPVGQLRSLRLRYAFAIDVARALAYLHAHNMTHRDVKLENLLLTENMRVKVCDFGFSRLQPALVSPVSTKSKHERKLSYCGTEDYMAPELILCMDYTNSIDIFSFGVVLLSLMMLQLPITVVFRRVIPGFGLDMTMISDELPPYIPAKDKLMEVLAGALHEDGNKRQSWRFILGLLKENESGILQKIRELGVTPIPHVGLPTSDIQSPGNSNSDLNVRSGESKFDAVSSPVSSSSLSGISKHEKGSTSNYIYGSFSAIPSPSSPNQQQSNGTQIRMRHEVPHRFSVFKTLPLLHQVKCQACSKSLHGLMASYLSCDDCGFTCHKKCAASVAPTCGLKMAMLQAAHLSSMSMDNISDAPAATLASGTASRKKTTTNS